MADDLLALTDLLRLPRFSVVGLSMGGRVAIAFAGSHRGRVDRLVVVDIGPEIARAGRLRVGALLAQTPERFDDLDAALAWARTANPCYTDVMLRHRVVHGTGRPAAASCGSTTARSATRSGRDGGSRARR
jgi:pimeloyl-ACP methyl ester carboxylesterase